VVDLFAGLALAETLWRVAPSVEPWVEAVAAFVQRFEPKGA
jgi:hypothetical protein